MGYELSYGPIRLDLISHYRFLNQELLRKRRAFQIKVDSRNSILRKYLEMHESLLTRIAEINSQIRDNLRGTATDGRNIGNPVDELIESVAIQSANAHLCRQYAKRLFGVLHPDRKGDKDQFIAVQQALARNDLFYLQHVFYATIHKHNLYWQCSEGIQLLQDCIAHLDVQHKKLEATQGFSIVRSHLAGHYEEAKLQTEKLLNLTLIARTRELLNLLGKQNVQR